MFGTVRRSKQILSVFLVWFVLFGNSIFPTAVQADGIQTQEPAIQPLTLKPGESLERELKGGETHRYSLQLKANDYLKLVVEQKGIDVVVRLIGPDGKQLVEVDSPNGTQGPEPVSFISKAEGNYQLEIETLESSTPSGRYRITLEGFNTATDQDLAQVEIKRLSDEAAQFEKEGKYDLALPLAVKAFEESEKIFGPENLLIAKKLNALALLYYYKGDSTKAEPLYLRALAIDEKALGLDHPDVASILDNLALLYNGQGNFNKAEPLFLRSLMIREKKLSPDHPDVATSLNNLALFYDGKGDYSRAEPLYLQALAINEKVFGQNHLEVATNLNNLAGLYESKGDYAKAEPLYYRALAIRENTLGPDHPFVAESLNNLALLFQSIGDYTRAEPLYHRALAIDEKALGADHPSVATDLNNLALFYYAKQDYTRAEPLCLRSLEIREKSLGSNHPSVATSLNNLALLYYANGDYLHAEPLLLRSLVIREKMLGPDHPSVLTSLNNLAGFYQTKGDYTKAESFNMRSLTGYEQTLGPDHPFVAQSLNNLARLLQIKGDYAKAELIYKRALAIREKTLGPDHLDVAQSLSNLALLYFNKGDYTKAEPLFLRDLTISEKVLGQDNSSVAASLSNLAMLYKAKGDYARAEPIYLRALSIKEKYLSPDHPDIAQTLNNLALLYYAKGDYARAEPLYKHSLSIYEKSLGSNHPEVATVLNNLAGLYKIKGDNSKAEPLYKHSLSIYEKSLGSNHPEVATSLNNLAEFYYANGNILKAVDYLSHSNEITEHDLWRNLTTGSENQKLLYLNTTSGRTSFCISLHTQSAPDNQEALRTALKVVLRRKGRALEAMASSIEVLRKQSDAETQKLLDDYSSLVSQISVLTLCGPGKQKLEDHFAYLAELNTQKEKLEGDISRRSAQFQSQITPITLEGVQNAIPANAVLVEYTSYWPFDPKNSTFGTPRFVVYTLEKNGTPKFADLGDAEPIEKDAFDLRRLIRASGGVRGTEIIGEVGGEESVDEQIQTVSQRLYQRVMKPVDELVGKNRHLLISPDGGLNLVPFASLQDEKGKYVLEKYTLTFLTSGRDLLRLKVKIPSQDPAVVVADPTYGDGTGPVLLGKDIGRLRQLDGTKAEGTFLKRLFPKAQVWMENQATKDRLKAVSKPALVHIATHGFFLEDAPKEPLNGTDFQRGITLGDTPPPVNVEQLREANPLLRSCLFFAGANGTANSTGESGTMTALEATGLDLWGTKLVVLSACDTGLGEVKNGDGVYGLRRALVLAGSEAQMMSLWPVSDEGTKELMQQYYTRLKAGEGRSEALRQVQLQMLKSKRWNHPFYWASFIQSGEWANLNGKRK